MASSGTKYTFLSSPDLAVQTTSGLSRSSDEEAAAGQSHTWGTGAGKSYLVPAVEIPAFVLALNGAARLILPNDKEDGKFVYATNPSTFFDNVVREDWHFDEDGFGINQIQHPYQGSIHYGMARSSGLGFWTSWGYAFMGSYLWEMGGETSKPSINDQIMTGIGGVFLAEPLFRIASLMLEDGGERPGFWNELGAAFASPPVGFNRLVFGERFSPVFPSKHPARFWRVNIGGSVMTDSTGETTDVPRNAVLAGFSIVYGLPGKPGYHYDRPFDYFEMELAAGKGPASVVEAIATRGLITGKEYEAGGAYRGIWGLYGSFDYFSPPAFRVSTAALSIGTTAQLWLSRLTALQFSALVGGGYGAGGTVPGVTPDYHHGADAQGLIGLRLIFGNRAMLEAARRQYYICQFGSGNPPGDELLGRTEAGLTVRISGRHAVSLKFLNATSDEYARHVHTRQSMNTVALSYTILSNEDFGAVEWRHETER